MSTHQENARQFLRSLLGGAAPNGITRQDLGIYGWVYEPLCDAYRLSGTPGVRKAFDSLVSRNSALATLIASDNRWEDLGGFTAAELQQMNLPEPEAIVDEVVYEGATVFAAKPKRGKSMLMQQIGVALSTGGKALGKIDVEQGRVLYLMLEGSKRGLRRRFEAMLQGAPFPDTLHIYQKWPSVQEGGVELLESWVRHFPDTRLIIVDTLKCIRGNVDPRRSLYEQDYDALHPFSELYEATGISSVIIHHANKRADESDIIDLVSGSTGLSGAVENVMAMVRDGSHTILKVRPREEEEVELALDFDPQLMTWILQGKAELVAKTEERQKVLDVLKKSDEAMRPSDIAAIIDQPTNNVKQLLFKLKLSGRVHQPKYGYYALVITSNTDNTDNGNGFSVPKMSEVKR